MEKTAAEALMLYSYTTMRSKKGEAGFVFLIISFLSIFVPAYILLLFFCLCFSLISILPRPITLLLSVVLCWGVPGSSPLIGCSGAFFVTFGHSSCGICYDG